MIPLLKPTNRRRAPHAETQLRGARSTAGRFARRRRGAVAVQVAILMLVLLGFAALTVDVGHLCTVKAELQNAADAAALAGASAFADSNLNVPDKTPRKKENHPKLINLARKRAVAYAAANSADTRTVLVDTKDVIVGRFDWDNPDQPLSDEGLFNAVQVTATFAEKNQNGPVVNFFAGILGFNTSDVSAMAVAAFNDRVSGYDPDDPSGILPFTIDKDMFEDQMVNGPDSFGFDPELDVVQNFSDGIPEVDLYPYKYKDMDPGNDGAGNFGSLNIGVDNQGTTEFVNQILHGVTPEQLEDETGSPELTFADNEGNATSYYISGNPGISGGMEPALETHIGNIVGFFLHTEVAGTGSNAVYTIVGMRFGRVMEVELSGNQESKRFIIQPVVVEDDNTETDPDAPDTGGLLGRVMIVR